MNVPSETNLPLFASRFPDLAKRLEAIPAPKITPTRDGGHYVQKVTSDGSSPLTNPMNPIEEAAQAVRTMENRLTGGLAPAVIAGLRAGFALDIVFTHFKIRAENHNEPFRRIYVIADSLDCLAGWLNAADRREILNREEVEFVAGDEVAAIVQRCEEDEQRSHHFIPISVLPENEMNRLIEPLAKLFLRREEEAKRWRAENEAYYDDLDDETLATIIQGQADRKPRLLMPAHASSTVVQYSARDTCSAFEKIGWETRILTIADDLCAWRVAKTIRDYRPDVLIFINHLRTEDATGNYPKNLMFVTWIQDTIPEILRRDAAEKWTKMALGR